MISHDTFASTKISAFIQVLISRFNNKNKNTMKTKRLLHIEKITGINITKTEYRS